MKIHSLLIILVVGTFINLAAMPWLVLAQKATSTTDDNEVLTLEGAQQAAAKITVRIRVGQGGGSGVLLAKKGSTYLVLTNAHAVKGQGSVTVTTFDGQIQVARRVENAQVGDFDLALLEFNSAQAYDLAKLNNFKDPEKEARLRENHPVFAAGFPYSANGLRLVEGKITQLPQKAFKNGTQIGYVTQGDLIQGMSGGPVLAINGDLVGINSTLARPIVDNYVYADGRKAPPDKVAEYREANWSVPMYSVLTRLNPDILYSYKQLPQLHRSVAPTGYMAELDRKARAVTVRIEKGNGGNGSGVIIAKEGHTYYVLTAYHVVKDVSKLSVITHDQRMHQIIDIQSQRGVDLAVVKFTSFQGYQSAILGNYHVTDGSTTFSSGWPAPKYIKSQQWQWQINPGIISSREQGEFEARDKQSFSNGYDLIYSSLTYGGMSGGPVFDHAGKVIGIHGSAEGINDNVLGYSLGISIKIFAGLADKLSIQKHNLHFDILAPDPLSDKQLESVNLVQNNIAIPNNRNDYKQWIEYGNQLYRLGKTNAAVQAFDRASILEPNVIDAYYGKGLALISNGDPLGGLKAMDKAITLIPPSKTSYYYYLWKYRSFAFRRLQRYSEALLAISQAINLEPQDINLLNAKAQILNEIKQYPEVVKIYDEIIKREIKYWAYYNRGLAKSALGNKKEAILDYNYAIAINPEFTDAYYNRGFAKYILGNRQEAISDYDQAIKINPEFAEAYTNRGLAKYDLGNRQEAIFDYDQAIKINPKLADAYYNRGNAKSDLRDKRGAISDYNRAIEINPQLAEAYYNRGLAKHALGDKQEAINDLRTASQLFKAQNDQKLYNSAINLIQKLSNLSHIPLFQKAGK